LRAIAAMREGGSRRRGPSACRPASPRDGFQILGEAHVQHLVGLVEDQYAERRQLERAAAQVVERASRRGDDDVHAAAERADLRAHGRAAVDRQDGDAEGPPVPMHRLGDLHRELSRRHQDEGRRSLARRRLRVMRWRRGRANAAVFPVPVAACASTSRCFKSGGMAAI